MALEVAIESNPDCWNTSGESDTLVLNQCGDVGGLYLAAREDDSCARHHRGKRDAPTVGVKHRDNLQDRIALGDGERIGQREREAVQKKRAVSVDDALRVAGGSGSVTSCRRCV